jgi:hypothetical protein
MVNQHSRTIDHKTVSNILQRYESLFTFSQSEEAVEHLLIRFRRYYEYTPIVAGRCRIIELLEAGWKVSTICEVMQVSRPLVYYGSADLRQKESWDYTVNLPYGFTSKRLFQ